MQYSIIDSGPEVVVKLDGQVNYACSGDFKKLMGELVPYKGRRMVFDIEQIHHIDSVGLGFLYVAKEELSLPNCPLGLKAPQEAVRRLLELTESYADFDIRV